METETIYSDRKDRRRHRSGDRQTENETQKSQETRSRSHSPAMMEAGFELWPADLQGKIQMMKQAEFQARFREDLKEEIELVTQANSGHATGLIYFWHPLL